MIGTVAKSRSCGFAQHAQLSSSYGSRQPAVALLARTFAALDIFPVYPRYSTCTPAMSMRLLTATTLLLLLCGCSVSVNRSPAASGGDEAAVVAAIEHLFEGMRQGDTTIVRSVLHPDVRLISIGSQGGVTAARTVPMDAFVRAVGAPHDEVWDERISQPIVQIDGDLAAAWMNYEFHLGERFSHCGVNAMQLFRDDSGWKIIQIADTRRSDACGPVRTP